LRRLAVILAACLALPGAAATRDQVRVVGSSTVFPSRGGRFAGRRPSGTVPANRRRDKRGPAPLPPAAALAMPARL